MKGEGAATALTPSAEQIEEVNTYYDALYTLSGTLYHHDIFLNTKTTAKTGPVHK